jgi:endonuclease/exonuclease/phosphatase (EEP) superfamily protein YafD
VSATSETPRKSKQTQVIAEPPPKKKRRRFSFATALLLLIGLGGLIASRLGNLWPEFDVFAQFTVQFACVTIAAALAMLLPRFKFLAALVLLIAMIVGYGAWPLIVSGGLPQQMAAVNANERLLSISSFNTHAENKNPESIEASIRKLNTDVVVLLEVEKSRLLMLENLRKDWPFQYPCHSVDEHCKMAIISRTPLYDTSAQTLWEGPPNIKASLGPEFGGVTIVGVHTTRFPHSRAQLKQVRALVKSLEQFTGPIIVAGDFNATPYSRVITTMAEGSGLVRHTNLPTWPAWLQIPQLAIDHIFASSTLRPLGKQIIGDAAGSDHFPVSMTFAVPKR